MRCAGSIGLGVIATAPSIPTSWFAAWAFHSLSSRTNVRRPEASTMVALLAAKFWTCTFQVQKMSSGSISREQAIPVARGSMVVVVILELTNTVVVVK